MTDAISRPVFGARFSLATRSQIVEEVCTAIPQAGSGLKLLVTTNIDHIWRLRSDPKFVDVYKRTWKLVIDGSPILFYARLRGAPVPERVTGADLFPEIMAQLSPAVHRPFFVAAKPHSAVFIEKWLLSRGFLPSQFAIEVPPFGFENDAVFSTALASKIKTLGTTHLFMGVGCPKSEFWADKYRQELGDLYAFGFGAALEFFSGTARRAPRIFQRLGVEWVWRLMLEPKRLASRYWTAFWGVLPAIWEDLRFDGRFPTDRKL